jgi:hypothetical protein
MANSPEALSAVGGEAMPASKSVKRKPFQGIHKPGRQPQRCALTHVGHIGI